MKSPKRSNPNPLPTGTILYSLNHMVGSNVDPLKNIIQMDFTNPGSNITSFAQIGILYSSSREGERKSFEIKL